MESQLDLSYQDPHCNIITTWDCSLSLPCFIFTSPRRALSLFPTAHGGQMAPQKHPSFAITCPATEREDHLILLVKFQIPVNNSAWINIYPRAIDDAEGGGWGGRSSLWSHGCPATTMRTEEREISRQISQCYNIKLTLFDQLFKMPIRNLKMKKI